MCVVGEVVGCLIEVGDWFGFYCIEIVDFCCEKWWFGKGWVGNVCWVWFGFVVVEIGFDNLL